MGDRLHNRFVGHQYTLHQVFIPFLQHTVDLLDQNEYGQRQFNSTLQSFRKCKYSRSVQRYTASILLYELTKLFVLQMGVFNAPFFTTWFSTNWTVLFFPIYYCVQLASSRALTPAEILCESVRNFRNSHFTAGQ